MNDIPTLSQLIQLWIDEESIKGVNIQKLNESYSSLFTDTWWIGDIDNTTGIAYISGDKERLWLIEAAEPDFFEQLKVHIERVKSEYRKPHIHGTF